MTVLKYYNVAQCVCIVLVACGAAGSDCFVAPCRTELIKQSGTCLQLCRATQDHFDQNKLLRSQRQLTDRVRLWLETQTDSDSHAALRRLSTDERERCAQACALTYNSHVTP